MAKVTARIKLRTEVPESTEITLEKGEVYINTQTANQLSIYVGDGETALIYDGETVSSGLTPFVLKVVNGTLQPSNVGPITNNSNTQATLGKGGTLTNEGTISGGTLSGNIISGATKVNVTDASYGDSLPNPANDGDVFFKVVG